MTQYQWIDGMLFQWVRGYWRRVPGNVTLREQPLPDFVQKVREAVAFPEWEIPAWEKATWLY